MVGSVVLSRNTIIGDSDDLVLGTFGNLSPLPTSTSYSRREILPLPIATSGRFHLFVITDVNDEVYELPNNQSNIGSPANSVDVSTRPYSDLIVEGVSVPNAGQAGDEIEVSWTVANQGLSVTDTTSWTDLIYITPDPTLATGLRLIGTATHAVRWRWAIDTCSDQRFVFLGM